jgi:4-hydroxyphenylpyruvate dioxygenase
MRNHLALNLRTLGPGRTLEQKLYAAAAAGFAAVGLSQEDLESTEERARQELRLSDLRVAELEGVTGWLDPGHTARSLALVRAERVFATAAEVGASLVIAWPPSQPVEPLGAATCFADLCRAAQPFGVRVGLEFLRGSPSLKDLASAWRMVEVAEVDNGGLVIDAFHFFAGGSTLEAIEPVPADKIYLVQLCDAPDLHEWELEDRHRLYPGTGSLALEPLLAAIRGKGYDGYYSLELQNEVYWSEDPAIVSAEGLRSLRRLDIN